MTTSKLDWALHHAGRGLKVFPVHPNSKHPIEKDWPSLATSDPAQITEWWEQWPDANIGAHPGASGHVVFDIDTKKVDGYASWEKLLIELGKVPTTQWTYTPSGGAHYWFKLEGSCKNSANSLAPGVDTRGNRGFVVMGGSTIDDGEYVTQNFPIADVPQAWIPRLAKLGERDENRDTAEGVEIDHPGNIGRAEDYVNAMISTDDVAIEGQGGNTRTFQMATMLRDMGLSMETALEVVSPWNSACRPSWDDSEIETIFYNAYEYAQNEIGAKALANPDGTSFADIPSPTTPSEGSGNNKASRFTPLSIDEMAELPEPEWLIEDLLPAYELSMMFGAYGSFKSFAALDMALSIAAGVPCLGLDYDQKQFPVLYMAGEGQIGIAKQRIPAWLKFHDVSSDIPFYAINETPIVGNGTSDLTALFAAIEAQCGDMLPRLIIIDTHARSMTGLDENTVQDTAKAIKFYEQIIHRYSAAGLVIHHTGHDKTKERGSTNFGASCSAIFRMEYDKPSQMAKLACTKMKDAEEPKPVFLEPTRCEQSIVLTRKEWTKPDVSDEPSHSELYISVVKVLKELQAHSLGSAITTASLAASMPDVVNSSPEEQEAARQKLIPILDKAAAKELRPLIYADEKPLQWLLPMTE